MPWVDEAVLFSSRHGSRTSASRGRRSARSGTASDPFRTDMAGEKPDGPYLLSSAGRSAISLGIGRLNRTRLDKIARCRIAFGRDEGVGPCTECSAHF